MMYRLFTLLTVFFIGFVMVAGCISQDETKPVSFEPPDVEPPDEVEPTFTSFHSLSATESNASFDLPFSSPPAELMVAVSVEKDPIYNTISVRFDGGRGQNLVRSAIARVTLSDGRIDQKELMPSIGNTVSFEGTDGMDVVEVLVTYMNGESYKVLLEAVGFIRPNIGVVAVETQEVVAIQEVVAPSGGGYGGPVTAPPNDSYVSVNVSKDAVYKTITATFGGGLGQDLVQVIGVFITLSDGSFLEYELEPRRGATVATGGTSGTDRVQVVVAYANGNIYKIIEAELGSRGGVVSN